MGFTKQNTKQQHIFKVEEQINHKYVVIKDKIKQQPNKPNLYFLSHSLGGFVTQRTIKKLLEDEELKDKFEIKFNRMITPTTNDIAGSESGTKMVRLNNSKLPIVGMAMTFSSLCSYIPESVQRYILTHHWTAPKQVIEEGSDHENVGLEHSLQTTMELINTPSLVNQALNMARDELDAISKLDEVNDWIYVDNQYSFKNWCFFAQLDHWVSNETRDHLISKYGQLNPKRNRFEICENVENPIKHAFVLNQSKEFAEITIDRIKQAENCWVKSG